MTQPLSLRIEIEHDKISQDKIVFLKRKMMTLNIKRWYDHSTQCVLMTQALSFRIEHDRFSQDKEVYFL